MYKKVKQKKIIELGVFGEFEKYKQNLRVVDNFIISYTTKVAEIKGNELHQLGWWSVTTQKHINYAASELGLKLIK
jgi:hypothetical protein